MGGPRSVRKAPATRCPAPIVNIKKRAAIKTMATIIIRHSNIKVKSDTDEGLPISSCRMHGNILILVLNALNAAFDLQGMVKYASGVDYDRNKIVAKGPSATAMLVTSGINTKPFTVKGADSSQSPYQQLINRMTSFRNPKGMAKFRLYLTKLQKLYGIDPAHGWSLYNGLILRAKAAQRDVEIEWAKNNPKKKLKGGDGSSFWTTGNIIGAGIAFYLILVTARSFTVAGQFLGISTFRLFGKLLMQDVRALAKLIPGSLKFATNPEYRAEAWKQFIQAIKDWWNNKNGDGGEAPGHGANPFVPNVAPAANPASAPAADPTPAEGDEPATNTDESTAGAEPSEGSSASVASLIAGAQRSNAAYAAAMRRSARSAGRLVSMMHGGNYVFYRRTPIYMSSLFGSVARRYYNFRGLPSSSSTYTPWIHSLFTKRRMVIAGSYFIGRGMGRMLGGLGEGSGQMCRFRFLRK